MAFLSGLAAGQANVVSCLHNSSDCKFSSFGLLKAKALFIASFGSWLKVVRLFLSAICDLLLEYDFIVFQSLAFARQLGGGVLRGLTGTEGIYTASENFQTLYLLSSWLPLASLSSLPPTPSLILSSFFLQFGVGHIKEERLSETLEFSSFLLFWTVFARWLWRVPKSLQPVVACSLRPSLLLKCIYHLIPEWTTQL